MATILQTADAISCLINKAVDNDAQFEHLTKLRTTPFAEVAVAPYVQRIKSRELRCFVEPVVRTVNSGETQDACSQEWLNGIGIVFCQRIDDQGRNDNQPSEICEIRELLNFVEAIGDRFLNDWNRIETKGGTTRIQKEETDQQLVNREWIREHQVFYSQLNVVYG